jgi:hypothetical protein
MLLIRICAAQTSPSQACMLCQNDEQPVNCAVNFLSELAFIMTAADQTVRIYQPAKSTTQSGQGKTGTWLLAFAAEVGKSADPLMGWVSSADTQQQLRLQFPSADAAVAYAKARGLAYVVQAPAVRALKLQSYADNFR